jgi:hypothetical protein
VKHDDQCELPKSPNSPTCHCAERAYLATATDAERDAWKKRRGYDTNIATGWDLPPRTGGSVL